MDEITKINPKHVVKIEIFYKKQHKYFFYRKQRKFCYFINQKEGFYNYFGFEKYISEEEIKQNINLYIEDNKVYYLPHIILYLSNNDADKLFFINKKEVDDFIEQLETNITLKTIYYE